MSEEGLSMLLSAISVAATVASTTYAAVSAAHRPKAPTAPSLAPTTDEGAQWASTMQAIASRRGRASTLLTGGPQSLGPTGATGSKTLLGI